MMSSEITPEQVLQETHLLARQNWREVEHLKALVSEQETKLAQFLIDYLALQQSLHRLFELQAKFDDKLDAVCRLVGDLQNLPEDCLRDRVAKLERRLRDQLPRI